MENEKSKNRIYPNETGKNNGNGIKKNGKREKNIKRNNKNRSLAKISRQTGKGDV